jgi:hypothetical protein
MTNSQRLNSRKIETRSQEAAKDVEFYSSAVNAWFNTALELDKSILTLSSAAIAALLALLAAVGEPTFIGRLLYAFSLGSFVVSIVLTLMIFKRNQELLAHLVNDQLPASQKLKRLDVALYWAFGAGIALAGLIGINALLTLPKRSETNGCQKEVCDQKSHQEGRAREDAQEGSCTELRRGRRPDGSEAEEDREIASWRHVADCSITEWLPNRAIFRGLPAAARDAR